MSTIDLSAILQWAIVLIGAILGLAVLDLKNKVRALDKLSHIDKILKDLNQVVNKLNDLVTKQEVAEKVTARDIDYLREEIKNLKDRTKYLEERSHDQ
jgi:cob(I)alamin adenosyltransferase